MRGSWRRNRTATYWPPLLWPLQCFFPVLLGCLTGGLGSTLLGAGFLYRILSPTDLNFNCSIGAWGPPLLDAGFLYRILSPTDWTSGGRHKSHSFNPSTVKVIFWYSSTGCTCYLRRCISCFDSPAESELNIQHFDKNIYLLSATLLNSRQRNERNRTNYRCHFERQRVLFVADKAFTTTQSRSFSDWKLNSKLPK